MGWHGMLYIYTSTMGWHGMLYIYTSTMGWHGMLYIYTSTMNWHRPNAFGVWQPRLHLCYETLKCLSNFSELA